MTPILPLPIVAPAHFCVIAHRGASAYAPENTESAFALARRMGVRDVELDVQLSRDGVAVVCHDHTLTRFGHTSVVVEEMAWSSLAQLDMGSWFSPFLYANQPMMRLDQLFARFGGDLRFHVEIKGRASDLPRTVHKLIEESDLADACVVTSFRYDALQSMRRLAPELHLGWLVHDIDAKVMEKARALDLYQLCPRADQVTAELVETARAAAPQVRAWGLRGTSVAEQRAEVITLIRQVVDAGCDGATIDWPDWIIPANHTAPVADRPRPA